jgi:hypothetical protein
MALYMVVEQFKSRDLKPVYARLREHGRMMPDGLNYVNSWIDIDNAQCYQVMETEDRALFDQWIAQWSDLFDVEIHEVVTSAEAAGQFSR